MSGRALVRSVSVLLLSSSCFSEPIADPPEISDGWSSVADADYLVRRGLVNAIRAPRRAGEEFAFSNPAWGLEAHVGDGVRFSEESSGPEVSLRFSSWGREGNHRQLSPVVPKEGDCVPGEYLPDGSCLRQVELERDGILEWWRNGDQGLQHGWQVIERPSGAGVLQLELSLSGATASVDGDTVRIRSVHGEHYRYARLRAWDASGEEISAYFDVRSSSIGVHVDDAGAEYPITIDPFLSTSSLVLSEGPGAFYGAPGIGDFNGDGFDDLAVGGMGYSGPEASEGKVWIYPGSADGISLTAVASFETN